MVLAIKSVLSFLKSAKFFALVKAVCSKLPQILKGSGLCIKLGSSVRSMPNDGDLGYRQQINQYFKGMFRKEVWFQNHPMRIKNYQQIFEERINCVKRYACSLTGWVPSGLFTPASLLLFGSASRHEFSIVHTEHHVVKIQITKKSNEPVEPITDIQIMSAGNTRDSRATAEKRLLEDHYYCRVLKKVEGRDLLENFRFKQMDAYVSYLIAIMRECGAKKYNLFTANCKTLSRSMVYFSESIADINCIVQSNLGIFTDKPLFIMSALSLDSLLMEKIAYWSAYMQHH